MFKLRMGNSAATTYFQELEKLAKLMGWRRDEGERGVLVKASQGVPQTYTQWKAHIIAMHEECQKKWAFNQATGSGFCKSCPQQKGSSNTATSHTKTDGATSSSPAKPTSNAAPRDASSGKWTTYAGRGEPMDISTLCREGKCFRCQKKGHLSKDCPDKKEYKDICSVHTAEQAKPEEKEESKVKEVKETAV
ncbi:hypothetical protein ARMSODRAFT_1026873 [Armillaria solidipes]|uniref:CCHC-type domain-containing protein n=1 Tax=Armillaria solidipes TaxID=1076256 RepID=A0A2H3B8D1_9AGAR|nr:hypothetical protein ARMSODRAFT_1026873 [Armillaria solidipes]